MKTQPQPHPLKPFCRAAVYRQLPHEPRRILALTIDDITRAGATPPELQRIIAAQRLAQFSAEFHLRETAVVADPRAAARAVLGIPGLRFLEHEELWCLPMDCKSNPLRPYRTSQGTTRSSLAHPREFFASALEQRAESVISCHNHPTGSLVPSEQDISVFEKLDASGQILGIPCVDHLIISRQGVHSHRQGGIVLEFTS